MGFLLLAIREVLLQISVLCHGICLKIDVYIFHTIYMAHNFLKSSFILVYSSFYHMLPLIFWMLIFCPVEWFWWRLLQVGLANILDMYYEDQYTNPGKQLLSGFTADFSKLSKSKVPGCIYFFFHLFFSSPFYKDYTSF